MHVVLKSDCMSRSFVLGLIVAETPIKLFILSFVASQLMVTVYTVVMTSSDSHSTETKV